MYKALNPLSILGVKVPTLHVYWPSDVTQLYCTVRWQTCTNRHGPLKSIGLLDGVGHLTVDSHIQLICLADAYRESIWSLHNHLDMNRERFMKCFVNCLNLTFKIMLHLYEGNSKMSCIWEPFWYLLFSIVCQLLITMRIFCTVFTNIWDTTHTYIFYLFIFYFINVSHHFSIKNIFKKHSYDNGRF